MAWPLLEDRAMDLVFHCASCCGVLIVREELRGLPVRCAHCADHVEAQNGQAVTEAIVSQFLDLPKPAAERRVLRRVRPAPRHSSADASH